MISYNAEKNLITLSNGKMSYVVYINPRGQLETLHLGAAWEGQEQDFSARPYVGGPELLDRASGKMYNAQNTYGVHREISSHGLGEKKDAPVLIRRENGSYVTDFRYVSHIVYKGVKPLTSQPHAKAGKDNSETIEILLKETSRELYLTYYLTIYVDKNILLKSMSIQNKTEKAVTLDRLYSMQLDLARSNFDLYHFHGRWAQERDLVKTPLSDGTFEVASNLGRSSHEQNPFMYFASPSATSDHGEVIGLNLIYSGNFIMRANVNRMKELHIVYGMNDEDFAWHLSSGETFEAPQAVISYSLDGVDGMSQAFHQFILDDLMTYKHNHAYKPVLFNSWEGCYFNFNTESVISYIDDAIKIGTELFVLDDGWFGQRNTDRLGLGDWYVNRNKIDLHKVMAHCKAKGIKFGIWFEPEMVNPDSDLYRAHPEYVPGEPEAETLTLHRHQLHLDMSNPHVVDNIYQQMKAFLEEYHVDYIKWDYNRVVMEHFSPYFNAENQGEIYHRMVLGYYDLISRIVRDYPDIMIEGCSSGGGRFDMGTLYYCPQIWTSDESDPAQRIALQYNTSLGYPLSSIGAHVNDHPITPYSTKAKLAFFGTYGYEMNPNKLTESEQAELSEIADIYVRYHQTVVEQGTLYHLVSPSESNDMCMQCVSPDRSTSIVLYMNKMKEHGMSRFVRLKGLAPKTAYKNSFDGQTYSGTYYMQVGLDLTHKAFGEFSAQLIILEEV